MEVNDKIMIMIMFIVSSLPFIHLYCVFNVLLIDKSCFSAIAKECEKFSERK